jgi:hypothetical protein
MPTPSHVYQFSSLSSREAHILDLMIFTSLRGRIAIVGTAAVTFALLLAGCSGSPVASPVPRQTAASLPASEADDLWNFYVGDDSFAERPQVVRVRYVSPAESAQVRVDCLLEQGFPDAHVTDDGGSTGGVIPEAQEEAFGVASYVCALRYPMDPAYSEPLTVDQLSELYDYYVGTLTPCIESRNIPVSEPPSRTAFIDNYQHDPWTPYLDTVGAVDQQMNGIFSECPQWPSGFYGY